MEVTNFLSVKQEGNDGSGGVGGWAKSPPIKDDASNHKEVISKFHIVERHLLSRLLYPNPVCILSTTSLEKKINVMVCSWLTPIDNMGRFFMSIKKTRHTAKILLEQSVHERIFGLNICNNKLQNLLLEIGSCSGKNLNKITEFNIETCKFGWEFIDENNGGKLLNVKPNLLRKDYKSCNIKEVRKKVGWLGFQKLKFLQQSPVHLICRITSVAAENHECVNNCIEEDIDHYKFFCEILFACTDKKIFDSNVYNKDSELLTFFGSKTFGVVK